MDDNYKFEIKIIKLLIKLSKKAYDNEESPVAAVITMQNKIVSYAYNTRNKQNLTINHAEILAIIKANKKLHSWRLNKCTLYTTIEPCEMCKSVIKESRIENNYYLLEKLPTKKQYNKTNFKKLLLKTTEIEYLNSYKEIVENFWKSKR
jgi:tRNA(adenine34) deaminase